MPKGDVRGLCRALVRDVTALRAQRPELKVAYLTDGASEFETVVLPLPVSRRAMDARHYQIGGAANWQKNRRQPRGAEFDRSFVPAMEAAAGPSPAWYKPESWRA